MDGNKIKSEKKSNYNELQSFYYQLFKNKDLRQNVMI